MELNEAFASQGVYCIEQIGIDPAKVNVNGGAIASWSSPRMYRRKADGNAITRTQAPEWTLWNRHDVHWWWNGSCRSFRARLATFQTTFIPMKASHLNVKRFEAERWRNTRSVPPKHFLVGSSEADKESVFVLREIVHHVG